jgi:hypothetical protein
MSTPLPFLAIVSLLVGCHSTPHGGQLPFRQMARDDVIRQKVVGTWQADARAFPGHAVTFVFSPDGSFISRKVLETGEHRYDAHWRAEGGFLILTPERGALPAQSDQFIAVWRVDDHELVCRPGISLAGEPWRFTR